jgi:hypothetical protein
MNALSSLALAAVFCGSASAIDALQGAPAAPASPASPAAPPAAPVAPAGQAQPGTPGGAVAPALPKIFETQVVAPPAPTISAVFGQTVGFAGEQLVVTGAVRSPMEGRFGQLANYFLKDGIWTANIGMADVTGVQPRDFTLQRLATAEGVIATCIERITSAPSTVAVLEPSGSDWVQTAVLAPPHATPRPGFGSAMATDGSTVAVASVDLRFTQKTGLPIENPEIFCFTKKDGTWQLDSKVMVPPASNKPRVSYWFGTAMDMDKDVMAVGSPAMIVPRKHEATPSSGESFVFVFRRGADGWQLEASINGASVTPFAGFGSKVAIEGDLLAVRASDMPADSSPARVFMFRREGTAWKPAGELVPAAGIAAGRTFGNSLTISKGRVLVSETHTMTADNGPDRSPGMVLVFEYRDGSWANTMRLQPKEPCNPNSFGQGVAANWPWVAVNRIKNEREGIPGGAYLYKLGQ